MNSLVKKYRRDILDILRQTRGDYKIIHQKLGMYCYDLMKKLVNGNNSKKIKLGPYDVVIQSLNEATFEYCYEKFGAYDIRYWDDTRIKAAIDVGFGLCKWLNKNKHMRWEEFFQIEMIKEFVFNDYRRNQGRLYHVHPNIANEFRDSQFKNVNCDDLRLPYDSIVIAVPPEANLKIHGHINGENEGYHPVTEIYVSEHSMQYAFDCNKKGWIQYKTITRCWTMHIVSNIDEETLNLPHISLTLTLAEGVPVERVLACDDVGGKRCIDTDIFSQVFRWVMNVVMYATWPEIPHQRFNADRRTHKLYERLPAKPSKKKGRKQKHQRNRQIVVLGGEAIIDRSSPHSMHWREGPQIEVAFVNKVKIPRHWQGYWCGTGRKIKKFIWKDHYYKGTGREAIQTHRERSSYLDKEKRV
jgi:hypothetical protein